MDVTPTFKIPGLLLAAAALSYSFNPPNPINASTKDGAVVPSTYERLMRIMFRGLGVYRVKYSQSAANRYIIEQKLLSRFVSG